MKRISVLLVVLGLISCAPSDNDSSSQLTDPVNQTRADGYVPIGMAIVKVSTDQGFARLQKSLSLLPQAHAVTSQVSYVVAPNTAFTIDVSKLIPTMNDTILDIGSLTVTALDANQLRVCGTNQNQKCSKAVIRIYTQPLQAWPSVEGFVNTSYGYGTPVTAGKTTADQVVGLGAANSALVQTYSIPNNLNRVRLNHFPSPTFKVASDFSNGGSGTYNMTLVVELALGE